MTAAPPPTDGASFIPDHDAQPTLQIEVSFPSEDASVVTLTGEIDMAGAPELSRALAALALGPSGGVTVDLAGVEFIDSIGIHALASAATRLREKGRTFEVVGATKNVQRVLEIARVEEILSPGAGDRHARLRPQ